jgi:arylsulfatase A-like enzyme
MSIPAMPRREFLYGTMATVLAAQSAAAAKGKRQPNIVFILADDMGYGDPAVYGSRKLKTPNIDRLAAEGLRFTQGYAGAPVCGPSRCALLTGLHSGHGRVRDNFALAAGSLGRKGEEKWRRPNLMPEDQTVAQMLQKAGYKTALMGKWHLDGYDPNAVPNNFGFDEFKGWLTQVEATQGYWPSQRMNNTKPIDLPENAGGAHGKYDTNMISDDSVAYIARHKQEPFFLYVAYDSPHSPYTAPDFGPYANEPWPDDAKYYAALIWYMDQGIGRILKALKEQGLDQDTVVFFASDNGPRSEETVQQTRVIDFFDSNAGLTGYKRDMYEGGIRDPWIVRWTNHIKPGVSDVPVYFPDFLPTALDFAGARAPRLDGISLMPTLMDGKALPEERVMYWEFYEPRFRQAVRLGQWKGVRLTRTGPVELYDLSSDPWESKNLATQHPDIAARLDAIMRREHKASPEYPDPAPGEENALSPLTGIK